MMATRIATRRASLPSAEPYKATRPAAGIAAAALGGATGYEAGVRALRSLVQCFQWIDPLTDDAPSATPETRRVSYRPSPYAQALYVAVWYAADVPNGTTLPAVNPKIDVQLNDDAGVGIDGYTIDDLPERRTNSRTADLAASGSTDTTGLLAGREQYASNSWVEAPLDVLGLAGADGWLHVEGTAVQILAVGWVEVVSAEVA
jgi:hypothetical protein